MAEDCVYKNIAVKREPLDTNRQRPITARPSVVKFAGVEFSVYYKGNIIEVVYRPGSEASKNAAVNALRARGLREGEHFTVTTRGSGRYAIRIAKVAYAKAVKALAQSGLKEGEHYTPRNKRREIVVKEERRDAVVNALKAAGLVEGKHFTVKSAKQYVIRLTSEGLREIQRIALSGGVEAERFIRGQEGVLSRRHGQAAVKKLIEVLTPVREEGALELPLPVYDEKGNLIARVVDLRYELVENGKVVDRRAGEDCRLRIVAECEAGGEKRRRKMKWCWKKREKKGEETVLYYFETARLTVKAAALKALTGRAKKGYAHLFSSDLDALRRFKALRDAVDKWREGRPAGNVQGK